MEATPKDNKPGTSALPSEGLAPTDPCTRCGQPLGVPLNFAPHVLTDGGARHVTCPTADAVDDLPELEWPECCFRKSTAVSRERLARIKSANHGLYGVLGVLSKIDIEEGGPLISSEFLRSNLIRAAEVCVDAIEWEIENLESDRLDEKERAAREVAA